MIMNIIDEIKQIEKVRNLSNIDKIMLCADGSVIAMLDAMFGSVSVKVLEQKTVQAVGKTARLLGVGKNEKINFRSALIHKGNRTLIYAQSYIPLTRLESGFKKDLFGTKLSIGAILKKYNIESRREIIKISFQEDELKYFCKRRKKLLSREYMIIRNCEVLALIKETFNPDFGASVIDK